MIVVLCPELTLLCTRSSVFYLFGSIICNSESIYILWKVIKQLYVKMQVSVKLANKVIRTSYCTVPSAIWQIFSSVSYFATYFGKLNNSKVWETSKVFVNVAKGYCATTNLSLALKLDRAIIFHSLDTTPLLFMLKMYFFKVKIHPIYLALFVKHKNYCSI